MHSITRLSFARSALRGLVSTLLALLLSFPAAALAAGGTLIGKTLTRIPGGNNYANRALVQPDGKILVAGAAHYGSLQYQITRYNANGTLDTAFATNGTILEPLGPGDGEAWAIALQPDGKIVVAGNVRSDKDRFGLARFNTDGTLDLSFGGGGSAKSAGPGDSGAFAMAMQADGKLVLGGYSMTAASGGRKVFTVARYNANDTLDTTFGVNGFAIAPAGSGDETINSIGLQADGKIVAAGSMSGGGMRILRFGTGGTLDGTWTTTSVAYINGGRDMLVQADGRIAIVGDVPGTPGEVGVLRLNPDGSIDSAFNNGACPSGACPGVAHMPISDAVTGYGIALQSGKYVVSGHTVRPSGQGTAFAVGRFTSSGLVDTTFGTSGSAVLQPTGSGDSGRGLALRGDGRIVVAGRANGGSGDLDSVALALTVDGVVDTTFNTSGFARLDVGSMSGEWKAAAATADGKIVTAGVTTTETGTKGGVIARFLADGTLDATFGTSGITRFAFPAYALALQSDGGIVVGGWSLVSAKKAMTFARFNASGGADSSFGASGIRVISPATNDEEINALAIQPNGAIVGGGFKTGAFLDAVVVRLTAAGALDTTFNGSGILDASLSTGSDEITGIAVQADGKIVAAGWAEVSGSQDSMTVTRVNANGTIDTSFGASGIANINFGTATSKGYALVLQPDGKILIAGKVFSSATSTDDFALARLTSAGVLDTTFGTNGLASNDFGNHNRIFALARLPNGKLLGAGETGGLFALVQYLGNGTLDTSFGTSGAVAEQINAGNDFASALAVGADGTLYVAGNGSGLLALARFSSDIASTTADVAIAQSAPSTATAGANVTFTLTVSNAGPGSATGVVVTDTLPAGVTFVSAPPGCASSSGTVTCNIASIANGASTQLAIVVRTSAAGTIVNGAGVTATQTDPNNANNTSSASVTVNAAPPAAADIGITQSASAATAGQDVTITLTISNAGPAAATGITVTDTLPAGLTFVSASAGCSNASGTVTCSFPGIGSGASLQLTLVAHAATAGTFTNNVSVSAAQADPNAANNASAAAVTVAAPPTGTVVNLSTRLQVGTGNNVLIGGFVIGGSAPKTVVVTAIGPSLAAAGIANFLPNPALTLVRSSDQQVIATNDDWATAANATQVNASGFAPADPRESAIMMTLPPGAYTAIVNDSSGRTGVGIVAVYEVDHPEVPLINIATRGQVLTGNDVMIAGFVIQGSAPRTVVITGIGPSLASAGIANPLANPTLTLVRSSDGVVIGTNDDWGLAANAADIQAAGFAPASPRESAIMMTLPPGAYTAIVSGVGNSTGVGIVAVYAR